MIRNIIFDLDGTLLDTSAGIIESVEYTIEKLDLPRLSEQQLRSFIGPPLYKSFMNNCGCDEEQAQQAVKVFRAYYQEGAVLHASHYDGMEELCRELHGKGFGLGVATNKPQRFADPLIHNFGLDRYITSVFGADESAKLTKADLIRLCMKDLGAEQPDTVLIGDTENDAAGADQAGVRFIAVTYGFGYTSAEDTGNYPCAGAADSPADIQKIIMTIE